MRGYAWPGNVRELENLMRRLAALARDELIDAPAVEEALREGQPGAELRTGPPVGEGIGASVEAHLARYFATFGDDLPPDGLYDRVLAEVEKPLLLAALAATGGNQIRAARLLGINRNTLRKLLTIRNIDPATLRRGN
jgi:two-component system nitrogen regulation response regulator GlnG